MAPGHPDISVFTASREPRFLDDCCRSLLAQRDGAWEWIVVLYRGARWRPEIDDPRIRVLVEDGIITAGAAKGLACAKAGGEILVELDDTGELCSDALGAISAALGDGSDAGFAFSDRARLLDDGTPDLRPLRADDGWGHEDAVVDGREVLVDRSFSPSPHNVSSAAYAPTHVRAFRRNVYVQAGGYDASADELEGHELATRLYRMTPFRHIPRCLYLERERPGGAAGSAGWLAARQGAVSDLYDRSIQPCALAWAQRQGLMALDLGAAHNKPAGYLGVDQYAGEGVDIVGDVTTGIDLPDSSVGVVRAVDFLEHVEDKVSMFNELYRLLAHGGMLLSLTPSTDGRGAYQDPTHVAPYNENSFWYFTDRQYGRFVPALTCRFQVSRLLTFFPNEWHEQHQVPYVCANLIAVKDGPRHGGPLNV